MGDREGPAVSFTHLGLTTWAALAPRNCAIGIDAASRNEFTGQYPFHRAFQDGELDAVPAEVVVDAPDAAAAVWSVKEAAVKALGCGFWLVDPLELYVSEWRRIRQGFASRVTLSGRTRQRFMSAELRPLRVCTFREHEVWVSAVVVAGLLV
jgi:phosphopantetheinyl transferase (holo-ACP synthase)